MRFSMTPILKLDPTKCTVIILIHLDFNDKLMNQDKAILINIMELFEKIRNLYRKIKNTLELYNQKSQLLVWE